MRHHELVERRAGRHQHRRRCAGPAARASGLLPQGRDGPRVPGEHGRVQRADVHAELERVRRHHAEHVTRAQALLDRAAPRREVSAAVAADDPGVAGAILEPGADRGQQHLRRQPALREHDRGDLLAQEPERQPRRLAEIRRADAELGVDDRRVVAEERLLPARRAALGDLVHGLAAEPFGQLARIGDRGRRHDESRRRAIVPTDAMQPAHEIGDVAAEHAAVRVELVDDHITQIFEELGPSWVMRQDARMQHVGIGQDQIGASAHGTARILRRIAVVREHPELGQRFRQLFQLRELILRERLRRKQIQDPRVAVVEQTLERRQVVAEGLAGGRRRDHDDVLAARDRLPGARLVSVELLDAAGAQRLGEASVQ